MRQPDQKGPGFQMSMGDTFNLFYFVARGHATCFTVFTRHTFGQQALGWNGLCAFLLIPLYAGFADAPEMLRFWALWVIALVLQRVRTAWAVVHGRKLHSQYGGHPWLGYLIPFVKSYRAAVAAECAAVFLAGVLLCSVSEAVGMFTAIGFWSLLIVYGVERQALLMEARRIRDAEIEMQARVDVYQGNYDNF
jgi:hypothetical protein